MTAGGANGANVLRAASGSACGKVILLGEHVVVHGRPALAAGIARYVHARVAPRADGVRTLSVDDPRVRAAVDEAAVLAGLDESAGFELELCGDLPVSVGLGSSAAMAVALLRALSASIRRPLAIERLAESANQLERQFHGRPSGIDTTAAAHGGLVWFEIGPPRVVRPIAAPAGLAFVVALSGTRHATGEMVGGLAARRAADREVYDRVFDAIGCLVLAARAAIECDDRPRLGKLMTMNHELLRACGISTPVLDRVVERALALGALGAKLTGGGGGGAVLVLPAGDDPEGLAHALRAEGIEAFTAHIAAPGGDA